MTRRGNLPVAVALAVVGGLLVVGGTSADWLTADRVRDVGGVAVPATERTPGIDVVPRAAPVGVTAVVLGLALLLAPRRVRRAVGVLLALAGLAGLGLLVAGIVGALDRPGALTTAPWVAVVGAVGTGAAGVLALLRPRTAPALGPRYSLEGRDEADDEWGLASDE